MRAVFLDYDAIGPADVDPGPLRDLLPELELFPETAPGLIATRLQGAAVALVNKVKLDRPLLTTLPELRYICLAATGTDNVDLAAARELGIGVANIRNYCAPAVVQHVFALLLALNQRLREYEALVASGAWQRSASFCLLDYPFAELQGRTLGIVGLGTLGRGVAAVARAFGMRVLAAQQPYDLEAPPVVAPPTGEVQRVSLAQLLMEADVVSLHCPLNPGTRGLINAASIARMRRGALLINTARGALVEPEPLLAALRSGQLGGAGIDVLDHEPPVTGHPLLAARLPNLVVTPHIAWATRESRQRALDEMALNIRDFLAGGQRNRVA